MDECKSTDSDELKLVLDTTTERTKDIGQLVEELVSKDENEYIRSATIFLVLDALRNNSNIFKLARPPMTAPPKDFDVREVK